jgi:pimeloyl-ACP methyl ester carboxylesterase
MVILRQLATWIGAALVGLAGSAAAETSQGVVSANGLQMAYMQRGPASGPPILLIRGVGRTIETGPDPIADQLVVKGLRWIAFDNRDSGASTHLPEAGPPDYEAI